MDNATKISKIKTAIEDYENNLKNFASGRVKPQPGEIFANKQELVRLRNRLAILENQEVANQV